MAKKKGTPLSQAARALGSAGGKRGGSARARVLTPGRRHDIAVQGGKARQKQKKGKK